MKRTVEIILTILIFNSVCLSQKIDSLMYLGVDSLYHLQLELKSKQGILSDCEFAMKNASKDFNDNIYTLHSNEFSGNCSYCAVLKRDYNINWRFTDDLFSDEYYRCYDSIIRKNLIEKYNVDVFKIAQIKSDSLEKTDKWIGKAEYTGGHQEVLKFILSRLTIDSTVMDKIKTKLLIEIEIDTAGKVINPVVRKGVSESIDNKIIDILRQMPDWKPAYLYGKPIRQMYVIPISIEYE